MAHHLLFSRASIFDVMETQKQRLREELQRLPISDFDDGNLPQRLASKYGIDVPVMDEAAKYAKQQQVQVDVSRDPTRFITDRSRPFHLQGTELTIFVPFTGDPDVFNIQPTSFDLNPPRADVVGNELCFTYIFVTAPASLTTEYERTIGQVRKYLEWLRPSAGQLQSELERMVQEIAGQRKKQAAEHSDALSKLGIPLRDDVPKPAAAMPRTAAAPTRAALPATARSRKPAAWDVFVSHASEDKEEIARPLAKALTAKGLAVWYDEFSLKIGDSLRQSIDHGLVRSKFGVVILSPHFFEKHWTQQELNGLATRELDGKKVILPVWHKVGFKEVRQYSPMLADRLAVGTTEGLDKVVERIMEAMW